jgi:antagonist of KipI
VSIIIIKPGFQTTIQDLGRLGFKRSGVPESGCMDRFSARIANILCGNNEHDAVLEMLLHGVELLTLIPLMAVFSGGGAQPTINNQLIPLNRPVYVPANSTILTLPQIGGMRLYMAIAGGFEQPILMNSRSTYLPAGAGTQLNAGKVLEAGIASYLSTSICKNVLNHKNSLGISKWGLSSNYFSYQTDSIKMSKGVEWDKFTQEAHHDFLDESFLISPQSNRMGYRLNGKPLMMVEKFEMISTAVSRGTIQVTPDGTLLILMADAQTTGGYPRIGQVTETDMGILAQKRPGESIYFELVSLESAFDNLVAQEQTIKQIAQAVSILFN